MTTFKNKNYIWHSFRTIDMYDNFDFKKVDIDASIPKQYNLSKKALCAEILAYAFYLILLDIIENSITFALPAIHRDAFFYVKEFSGDEFKKRYNWGSFNGIDYIQSGFKGYRIQFRYQTNYGYNDKPVYLDKDLKKKFYDNINNGKVYY